MFKCVKCQSENLGYQKYVKSVARVIRREDGALEYQEPVYDDNSTIDHFQGFCCADCGKLLEHCGIRVETEEELEIYEKMDPAVRELQQKQWEQEMAELAQGDEEKQEICSEVFTD
jgi:hypothetical protein